MERIFWLLSGSDSQATRALMEQFERTQSLHLPKELHSKVGYWPYAVGVGLCNFHSQQSNHLTEVQQDSVDSVDSNVWCLTSSGLF